MCELKYPSLPWDIVTNPCLDVNKEDAKPKKWWEIGLNILPDLVTAVGGVIGGSKATKPPVVVDNTPPEKSKKDNTFWIIIGVAVLVIVGLFVFLVKRKK